LNNCVRDVFIYYVARISHRAGVGRDPGSRE
jgi:hypothetical protein